MTKLFQFISENGKWWIQLGVAFCFGAGAMYIYIFNPQGLNNRIIVVEQNQNAIFGGVNNHEGRVKTIEAFLQRAVEEANKK